MWKTGVLGGHMPKLYNTILYLVDVNFALWGGGGSEHKNLICPGFGLQITYECDDDGIPCLV